MLIGLISDTHGSFCNWEKALGIFNEYGCEKIIHLGDYLYHGPRNPIPECYDPLKLAESLKKTAEKMIFVKGNCDADIDLDLIGINPPKFLTEKFGNYGFLLTHGDNPDVQSAAEIAKNENLDVVVHGHTHVFRIERVGNIFVVNPGSVSLPKNNNPKTVCILEVSENLNFKIIDFDGKILKEVGS